VLLGRITATSFDSDISNNFSALCLPCCHIRAPGLNHLMD